tara:strand:- start:1294 stop:1719 length:426 start_codon:yes stop_codon:yes gene_type:complete
MSDIEEIKRFLNALYKRDNINVNHKNHIVKILDKLTKEVENIKDLANLKIEGLEKEVEGLKAEDKLNVEGLARLLKKRQKTIKLNLELSSENTKLKEQLKELEMQNKNCFDGLSARNGTLGGYLKSKGLEKNYRDYLLSNI